jgi:putative hydrolase of the HAD superfamily
MKLSPETLSGITTTTFDADDTLWDFEVGMWAALRQLRQYIVERADDVTEVPSVEEMSATRMSLNEQPEFQGETLGALRREAIRRSAGASGLSGSEIIAELFALYVSVRLENTTLFPETEPTLAILGERFQLGVITNADTQPSAMGLSSQFSFAVLADTEPFHKPDPRIFQHAASIGGYELRRSVHVGDSLVTDVAGANNAGAVSVWLDRLGVGNGEIALADYTIASLSEMPELLGIG